MTHQTSLLVVGCGATKYSKQTRCPSRVVVVVVVHKQQFGIRCPNANG